MNCQALSNLIQWRCSPAGERAIRATSPMTYGDDGLHMSFYILQPDDHSYYVTDGHQAVMHASERGVTFSKARCEKISSTPGARFAEITEDGEIVARATESTLKSALWDALRLSMAISNREDEWLPRSHQERFATRVRKYLQQTLPQHRLASKPVVSGASGHTIEFPIAVLGAGNVLRYIQPVGLDERHKMDWGHIYQTFGKFSDLKLVSEPGLHNRIAMFEDGADAEEFGRASTLLADAAAIQVFRPGKQLLDALAA